MDMVLSTPRLFRNPGTTSASRFAAADPAAAATSRFACPECQGAVSGVADTADAVMQCPSCMGVIVPPHPEFGCRAMPYLDWLRFQEMSVEESIREMVNDDVPAALRLPARLRAGWQLAGKQACWTGAILTTVALGWLARERLAESTSLAPPPEAPWEQSGFLVSSGASQTTAEVMAEVHLSGSALSSSSSPAPSMPYRGPDVSDAFRRSLQTAHDPSSLPE